jgi:hypothetical protein
MPLMRAIVKLKLISIVLAGALAPITQLNAQLISPAGDYTKKGGGEGKMRVEKAEQGWRVFVVAGGIPNGGATAADCTLVAVGVIKANAFQGEITYGGDAGDEKLGPNFAVEAGHKINIAYAPNSATLTRADVGGICGSGTGLFGRYAKDRK